MIDQSYPIEYHDNYSSVSRDGVDGWEFWEGGKIYLGSCVVDDRVEDFEVICNGSRRPREAKMSLRATTDDEEGLERDSGNKSCS